MGRMHIVLDDKIETRLRKKLGRIGFKKGDLSRYFENLIKKDLKNKMEVK